MLWRTLPIVIISLLAAGCASTRYAAVSDLPISTADVQGTDGPLQLQVTKSGPAKTLLVISNNWKPGDSSTLVHRTLAVLVDAPLKPGRVWLRYDNTVLITYSGFSAPYKTHMDVTGSIDIKRVTDRGIEAEVLLHSNAEFAQTRWVDYPLDPVSYLPPWHLQQSCTFTLTTPQDPLFREAAIQWVPSKVADRVAENR